jgi:hypothetical protein
VQLIARFRLTKVNCVYIGLVENLYKEKLAVGGTAPDVPAGLKIVFFGLMMLSKCNNSFGKHNHSYSECTNPFE